ncbi:NAD(P)H-binding protein [Streptomyces sp. FH025]|uniref:NAD(P)H-binding protein n=1 Tax=Streptomyces sp. FH025 TaxID=2815937 RepID=UPI001A9DDFC4|nr:NAD(P)H-binding protein [Streptomyces sp. FH025]MBO1413300.1 NAD(P)H-binding protein [Streptomyces sp. FH025]
MTSQIVVFGATGSAGNLAVESLLRRGIRPVLAGRRTEELAVLAAAHGGLDYRTADVTDPATVRALVSPGDVLVTTVGPFERYGLGLPPTCGFPAATPSQGTERVQRSGPARSRPPSCPRRPATGWTAWM